MVIYFSVEVVCVVVAHVVIRMRVFARIDDQVQIVDTVASLFSQIGFCVIVVCKHSVSEVVHTLCAFHLFPLSPFALPFNGISLAYRLRFPEIVCRVHLQP